MPYQQPLAYLLGIEGVALLRAFAGDFDREFGDARVAAIRRLLDTPELGGDGVRRMGDAMIEYASGHEQPSQQALKDLIAKHAGDMAYQVGDVYAWRGEKDKAIEWLERAYQQRDSGLNGIAYDPLLAGLQSDPRYGALLKKLELAD